MSEDHQRAKEDDQVHEHIQPLSRKVECSAVDALGARVFRVPLRLKWHAPDHLHDKNSKIAGRQGGDDAEAQVLFPWQRGDAIVLQHDGELEEEMRQGVELNHADSDSGDLFELGGTDEFDVTSGPEDHGWRG